LKAPSFWEALTAPDCKVIRPLPPTSRIALTAVYPVVYIMLRL
jgi:hypothetical protein